jgi:3-oxoacyl-[acyl-carrier-protein] synthase III
MLHRNMTTASPSPSPALPAVGVLATGTYLPTPRMTSEELSRRTGIPRVVLESKFGLRQKPVPGPDDHPCEMGARAARIALERAGIDPLEIDVVVSISEEHKERPLMVSGIKIQQLVGAKNAWAVDVAQRCCTTIAGLTLARALMQTDPRVKTVLLAGGYRNGDLIDYRNPNVSFMYGLAAGGGALLLRRDHGDNHLLGGALVSDGDFADDVSCAAGGTLQPLTRELVGTAAAMLDVHDPDGMKARLAERSHRNFMRVIAEAAGGRPIDYLALLHMKRSAHAAVLAELGLAAEQSTYLEDHGHIGQFDPILSLELGLAAGRVKPGALVVMASAGVSYAWGAYALRWGPAQ